jgi:hypothetical protein
MEETEIVEIPIADANAEEAPAPPEIVEPAPQAKKRGRPKGSKNKKEETPVVPKARKKIKIVSPPSESEEEQPSPKRRRVAAPQPTPPVYEPPDTRAIAAEVLTMLANRHVDRSAAKREKYRTWFANPV